MTAFVFFGGSWGGFLQHILQMKYKHIPLAFPTRKHMTEHKTKSAIVNFLELGILPLMLLEVFVKIPSYWKEWFPVYIR